MQSENILEVNNLTKKYGRTVAVGNVSLTVAAGEIFALIGPNGSGKTTLVKTIAGLLQPTQGKISVAGYEVGSKAVQAKQNTGYIPDEPAIWDGMSGSEFLYMVGALWGISPNEAHKRIEDLLKNFDLAADLNGPFEEYSRGSKQKISILAALLHQPKLLLVDEPIVGLDPAGAAAAKRLFGEFSKAGGAILLVTHTLQVAEEIAQRIGLLRQGELVAIGSLAELRAKAGLPAQASLEEIYLALTK